MTEFSRFSFCLIYPRPGNREACNPENTDERRQKNKNNKPPLRKPTRKAALFGERIGKGVD